MAPAFSCSAKDRAASQLGVGERGECLALRQEDGELVHGRGIAFEKRGYRSRIYGFTYYRQVMYHKRWVCMKA